MWQSYKQEGGCLVHFVRLATTLLKDEGSARYACHTIRDDTIRYDTRCYFNVPSKADMSQLNQQLNN